MVEMKRQTLSNEKETSCRSLLHRKKNTLLILEFTLSLLLPSPVSRILIASRSRTSHSVLCVSWSPSKPEGSSVQLPCTLHITRQMTQLTRRCRAPYLANHNCCSHKRHEVDRCRVTRKSNILGRLPFPVFYPGLLK